MLIKYINKYRIQVIQIMHTCFNEKYNRIMKYIICFWIFIDNKETKEEETEIFANVLYW